MKVANIFIAVLMIILMGAASAFAQLDLLSADEFMALKKADKELVIIDANKEKNYLANHIQGAIHIDHNDLYRDGPVAGLIKAPEELAVFFGEKGINEQSQIVVYDDGSQKYSSRTYWILKYIGALDVQVLHRDMDEWRKARVPLTSEPFVAKPTNFTPSPNAELLATIEYIKERKDQPEVMVVDARTADEYNGIVRSDGHIPGAVNLNYEELLTETGAFKPADELKAIAESKGLTPDKELLLYCRTSVRAAVLFVAFNNILGYDNVRVYDGAYLEWAADNPVVQ